MISTCEITDPWRSHASVLDPVLANRRSRYGKFWPFVWYFTRGKEGVWYELQEDQGLQAGGWLKQAFGDSFACL
jgi:hypothetical protein